MIPSWVCQVYPDHFPGKFPPKLSGKKHSRHFSDTGVRHTVPDIMATSVTHTTDPASLVSFIADGGSINTSFSKPLQIVSPPMITCFPKLGGIVPSTEPDATYATGTEPRPPEIDITMKGAEDAQNMFKDWMDKLDDHLLHFVHQNQQILGKKGLSIDAVKTLQKRGFRPRVSMRTGKSYPEAMSCRFKGKNEPLQVLDPNLVPIPPETHAGAAVYNDIIRVFLRYGGGYSRAGIFGNLWDLLAVQILGHAQEESAIPDPTAIFEEMDQSTWPKVGM